MTKILLILLCVLSLSEAARRTCSHCGRDKQSCAGPQSSHRQLITFTSNTIATQTPPALQVNAHRYRQRFVLGTSGVQLTDVLYSNTFPPLPSAAVQRYFAVSAWPATRAGTLQNLHVNALYYTLQNSTAIVPITNIGNVTFTIFTALPGPVAFQPTALSILTDFNLVTPSVQVDNTGANEDLILKDQTHAVSIAEDTRVAVSAEFAFAPRTFDVSGNPLVTMEFAISGSYEFVAH